MSPLTRTGQPQPCTADLDGAALRTAERRKAATYPELRSEGPQRLVVLGSEVGGRFNGDAHGLLRDLVRVRACRAPPALRAAAASGWTRRWWSILSVAVQQAVTSTALGRPWPLPPHAARATGSPLDRLLDLAEAEAEPPATAPGAVGVGVLGLAFGGKVVVAVAVGARSCHRAADTGEEKGVWKKNFV